MKYNPNIHHRRSVRLRGYDYAQEGMYFITICTKNRIHFFGEIENGEMNLNDFGEIAHREWEKISERWPHVKRGFDERIIRHARMFDNVSNYIINNPKNWKEDRFFD